MSRLLWTSRDNVIRPQFSRPALPEVDEAPSVREWVTTAAWVVAFFGFLWLLPSCSPNASPTAPVPPSPPPPSGIGSPSQPEGGTVSLLASAEEHMAEHCGPFAFVCDDRVRCSCVPPPLGRHPVPRGKP